MSIGKASGSISIIAFTQQSKPGGGLNRSGCVLLRSNTHLGGVSVVPTLWSDEGSVNSVFTARVALARLDRLVDLFTSTSSYIQPRISHLIKGVHSLIPC